MWLIIQGKVIYSTCIHLQYICVCLQVLLQIHYFLFQADPPDETKIPVGDAVGVTVVLLTCGYKGQEFVRVGYYVNNSYTDPELQENPPDTPQFDKVWVDHKK